MALSYKVNTNTSYYKSKMLAKHQSNYVKSMNKIKEYVTTHRINGYKRWQFLTIHRFAERMIENQG